MPWPVFVPIRESSLATPFRLETEMVCQLDCRQAMPTRSRASVYQVAAFLAAHDPRRPVVHASAIGVDEASEEVGCVLCDDRPLPVGHAELALVLAPGAVLGKSLGHCFHAFCATTVPGARTGEPGVRDGWPGCFESRSLSSLLCKSLRLRLFDVTG